MDEAEMPVLLSSKPLKSEFSHLNKIALTSEQFTVGRNIGNSVIIPFISISRLHCTFHKSENNEWFIKDSSSFGIRINNKKINKGHEVTISDGDIITFDPTAEFVYKFSNPKEPYEIPTKRIKLAKSADNSILDDVKVKFEESQNFEMKHIEEKIQNAKHLQSTSMILKKQLQADMDRKTEQLKSDFAQQIENLKGEKNEVEKQKALLLEERDQQLAHVRNEMEGRISELMEQIQKHNEAESELLKENNLLKEKLAKEREEFLSELSRENSSKQDLLERLEAKIQEQEKTMEREKQELQEALKKKTEELRLAQEKEKEREHIQDQLLQAQNKAEASLSELRRREVELASIAATRIQQEAEQSSEVIISLQDQLEKTRSALAAVETEKNTLRMCVDGVGEGTSKQSALNEVGEIMENELQCSICAELFIEALTLNCSHTFCKYCITTWKKKKKDCPICRAPITAENRSIVLDSFIEKMVQNLSEEMKAKRQDILTFRADQVSVSTNPRSATTSTSRRRRGTSRTSSRGTPRTSSRGTPRTSSRGRGVIIIPSGGTTSNQIATVDLSRAHIPMDPWDCPPGLAPPVQLERVRRPPRQEPPVMVLQEVRTPDGVGVNVSLASRARTTAATGAASAAGRAATGRPAAPSGSAPPPRPHPPVLRPARPNENVNAIPAYSVRLCTPHTLPRFAEARGVHSQTFSIRNGIFYVQSGNNNLHGGNNNPHGGNNHLQGGNNNLQGGNNYQQGGNINPQGSNISPSVDMADPPPVQFSAPRSGN